jgi:hypothetical protein
VLHNPVGLAGDRLGHVVDAARQFGGDIDAG